MVDFSDILNKRVEDIEQPKPLPQGTYLGQIMAPPKLIENEYTDKQTGEPKVFRKARFQVGLIGNLTADADAIEAAGGLNTPSGQPKSVYSDYSLDQDSLHRLKALGRSCGIEAENLGTLFEELAGKEVKIDVSLDPDRNDNTVFYNRGGRMAGTASD